jgi:hypothetical protein
MRRSPQSQAAAEWLSEAPCPHVMTAAAQRPWSESSALPTA